MDRSAEDILGADTKPSLKWPQALLIIIIVILAAVVVLVDSECTLATDSVKFS